MLPMNSNVQAALPLLIVFALCALVAFVPVVRARLARPRLDVSRIVTANLVHERRAVRETATHLLAAWSTANPGVLDATMVASAYAYAELIVANENVSPEAQLEVACQTDADYRAKLNEVYASHAGDALKPRPADAE